MEGPKWGQPPQQRNMFSDCRVDLEAKHFSGAHNCSNELLGLCRGIFTQQGKWGKAC